MRNNFNTKNNSYNYHLNSKKIVSKKTKTLATEVTYLTTKGEFYRINFVTKKYLDLVLWKKKNFNAPYFTIPNMVIVDEINNEKIQTAMKDLIINVKVRQQNQSFLVKRLYDCH